MGGDEAPIITRNNCFAQQNLTSNSGYGEMESLWEEQDDGK